MNGIQEAAKAFDDGAAHGQPQAQALGLAGVERLEHLANAFVVQPRAFVGYLDQGFLLVVDAGAYGNAGRFQVLALVGSFHVGFNAVTNQVNQHLLQQNRVCGDHRGILRQVLLQLYAVLFTFPLAQANHVAYHRV